MHLKFITSDTKCKVKKAQRKRSIELITVACTISAISLPRPIVSVKLNALWVIETLQAHLSVFLSFAKALALFLVKIVSVSLFFTVFLLKTTKDSAILQSPLQIRSSLSALSICRLPLLPLQLPFYSHTLLSFTAFSNKSFSRLRAFLFNWQMVLFSVLLF